MARNNLENGSFHQKSWGGILLVTDICWIFQTIRSTALKLCVFVWFDSLRPSQQFQSYLDGSSWVEPLLSRDWCVLAQGHNAVISSQALYHWATTLPESPGRVVQPVMCLATDACLTADPGVLSLIPARSNTFVQIDYEIISMVILLPSADSFKKGCCQLQAKVLCM